MKLIDLDLLKGKVEAMQACEPHYANNFLNDALNPSTEWGCIEDMIDSIPVIDAQPVKQGKWEWEPGHVGTTAKCSTCGLSPMGFYSLPIIQIGRLPEYKFCPNCGAYMGGDVK